MIEPNWPRIAGLHCRDDGTLAVVWLAHDSKTDVIHLYDACLFKREVMAVIAEGLNARGRWIPIAWEEKSGKEISEELTKRGCGILGVGIKETDAMAEVVSREIWERMRSGRFKVDRRLSEWLDEFKGFSREDSKVPRSSFPLMAATRLAIAAQTFAKPTEEDEEYNDEWDYHGRSAVSGY